MLWVVFTKSDSLISKVIRWATNGSYSHALLLWEDPMLGWMRMEAEWDGYHIRPHRQGSPRLDGIRVIEKVPVDSLNTCAIPLSNTYDGLLRVCAQWLGHRYDYQGIVGFLFVVIGRLIKKRWTNPLSSPSRLFCSEAIARGLKDMKHPGFSDIEPSEVSPQDLFDVLKQERKAIWSLEPKEQ